MVLHIKVSECANHQRHTFQISLFKMQATSMPNRQTQSFLLASTFKYDDCIKKTAAIYECDMKISDDVLIFVAIPKNRISQTNSEHSGTVIVPVPSMTKESANAV